MRTQIAGEESHVCGQHGIGVLDQAQFEVETQFAGPLFAGQVVPASIGFERVAAVAVGNQPLDLFARLDLDPAAEVTGQDKVIECDQVLGRAAVLAGGRQLLAGRLIPVLESVGIVLP
jgi:hypothetical protein